MSNNASQRIDFPIVGSFNEDTVLKVDPQRTINWYQVFDKEGKKPTYLAYWPGLTQIQTASEGGIGRAAVKYQGITETEDFAYFVIGEDIYRMDSAFILTRITDPVNKFITSSGHVGIASNANELVFVDNSRMLVWDTRTSTMTDQTASLPALPTPPGAQLVPKDITAMDGYLILINGAAQDQNLFFISALNDATTWTPSDFAVIDIDVPILNAVATLNRRLFIFGQEETQVWLDAGAADFPFRRDNNVMMEHGIAAIDSLDQGYGRIFYLANDKDGVGGVMMVQGTRSIKISTRQVDEAIQMLSSPNDATGFAFEINGQEFYVLNFTADNRSFVYNVKTNLWHEVNALDGTRYLANAHTYYRSTHFLVAYNDDAVYEMNSTYTAIDRNGVIENIKRVRICRVLSAPTYNRIRIDRLQIDMLQGVGQINTSGVDASPVIFLSISEDGGATYHDFGSRDVGAAGARLTRTIWRRLGVRRDTIVKVEMYNNVPAYILGGAVDLEVLPE